LLCCKGRYEGPQAINDFLADVQKTGRVTLLSDEREVNTYSKKYLLYKEGQRPRAVYHVISGKVKTTKCNDDGKEFITGIYGPGEFFGYTPVMENTSYKEGAQVLEDAQLMLIPREDFLLLLSSDMQVAQTFIKIITQNIAEKEESLLNLAYNSLRKKVAFGLIQLLEKYRKQAEENPVLNLSREHMAQSVGIATESLIRTLGDFKDEKLIDIQHGKVIITDEKKLRNLPY
jgi:CRP-like cAMP-binding protein